MVNILRQPKAFLPAGQSVNAHVWLTRIAAISSPLAARQPE